MNGCFQSFLCGSKPGGKAGGFILVLIILFLFSFSAHAASIVINEIGWSGTKFNSADEWIELFNATNQEIDVTDWKLYEGGGQTLIISFSGANLKNSKIPANGFYLIERSDDNTIDVPADLFDSFGGSGLNNSGENIVLKNNNGDVADAVNFSSGWPGGTASSSYFSMERIDTLQDGSLSSNWTSNNGFKANGYDGARNKINGTPKSENSVYVSGSNNVPPPPSSSNQENSITPETNESSNPPLQSSPAMPETFKVYAGEDKTVLAGQETVFSGKAADLKGKQIDNAGFLWNFGDGSISGIRVTTHTFLFPGKYIVNLNASIAEESHADYLNVEVLVPKITISEAKPGQDGFIEILNETGQKLDIGGLVIKDGLGGLFSIPKLTILDKNSLIVFPNVITQIFVKTADLILATSNGRIVDSAHFEGFVDGNQSFVRDGDSFVLSNSPSPGALNPHTNGSSQLSFGVGVNPVPVKFANVKPEPKSENDVAKIEPKITAVKEDIDSLKIAQNSKDTETLPAPSAALTEQIPPVERIALTAEAVEKSGFAVNSKIFLGASILVGILGATGFFLVRKFF